MEIMLGNQKIAIWTIFQNSTIFELKSIKCRFWTKVDQCGSLVSSRQIEVTYLVSFHEPKNETEI